MVELAEDRQAADIVLLDIRPVSSVADYFVICSGNSERQIGALTRESVAACLSAAGSFSAPITSTVPAAELALDATTGRVTVASVYQSACSRTGQGASPYTELLRALEQQNLASMHEHSISRAATEISKIKRARDSFCHLALTPEGKRRSSQWRYVKNDAFVIGSVHGWLQPFSGAWEIPIASAQLVAVTGVVADNLNARAEFTWRLVANDLGRFLPQRALRYSCVQLRRAPLGWRLKRTRASSRKVFRAPVLNLPIRPCYVASSDRNQMHGFRPDSSNNDLSVHPVRAADFANVASSYPQIERSYREDPAGITRHFFLAFFLLRKRRGPLSA